MSFKTDVLQVTTTLLLLIPWLAVAILAFYGLCNSGRNHLYRPEHKRLFFLHSFSGLLYLLINGYQIVSQIFDDLTLPSSITFNITQDRVIITIDFVLWLAFISSLLFLQMSTLPQRAVAYIYPSSPNIKLIIGGIIFSILWIMLFVFIFYFSSNINYIIYILTIFYLSIIFGFSCLSFYIFRKPIPLILSFFANWFDTISELNDKNNISLLSEKEVKLLISGWIHHQNLNTFIPIDVQQLCFHYIGFLIKTMYSQRNDKTEMKWNNRKTFSLQYISFIKQWKQDRILCNGYYIDRFEMGRIDHVSKVLSLNSVISVSGFVSLNLYFFKLIGSNDDDYHNVVLILKMCLYGFVLMELVSCCMILSVNSRFYKCCCCCLRNMANKRLFKYGEKICNEKQNLYSPKRSLLPSDASISQSPISKSFSFVNSLDSENNYRFLQKNNI